MQRRIFLQRSSAVFAASLGLPAIASGSLRHRPDDLTAEVEKLIPPLMTKANVPAVSAAIVQNGKITWAKAFGVKDAKSRTPVDTNTVFEAASVSKTVFACSVMKLCEKGKMNLDTPLVNYIGDKFIDDPQLALITPRHILSHQSGFQNWRSPEEPLKINFKPGSGFMYSGEGYFFLQSAITKLTGKVDESHCGSYEADIKVCATDIGDYLTKNVLVPNGMKSSGYVWTDSIGKNQALAHDIDGKFFEKGHQSATDMARYASAGGLLTTAKDYAAFMINLFTPKENDPFLLNKKSIAEMTRPQVKLPDDQKIDGASSWALGWAIQERPTGNVVLHSGGHPGCRSLVMTSLEKKNGFVLLSNSDSGGYVLYDEQLRGVLDRLFA